MNMLIETDSRSRAVIRGHPDQRFLGQENSDGSLLLIPAVVMSEAQYEYNSSSELQELLQRAMSSPSVKRSRKR